jgi:hypothetical protein
VDTWVQRLTHQRHTLPGLLAGLPVVDLTTTGRKSGLPRTAHLIAVPYGDTLALLGTNFGQDEVLARSEKLYIGYRKYQDRISGRRLRVFLLEPAQAPAGP